jgi:di/tricarboxylate transporter
MSERYCVNEAQVAAAAAAGTCDAAILDHARDCQICSEVLLVAKLLGAGAQLSPRELAGVPDATIVWRKAQALARKQAVLRATRPIRTARIAAFAVGVLAVPLLILRFRGLWPYVPNVWRGHVSSPYQTWFAGSSASLLMLTIGGAMILIAMSSWYMLREEH